VIAVSALLGLQLLALFGISLASFQVGGGMLLLTSTSTLAKINAEEMQAAAACASIAVMPLTIPPLTCSATMSTMVIYADKPQILLQLGTLVGYGVAVAQATALCFRLAEPIARAPGKTGINIMTRLMGLILAALAVEVMPDGL